MSQNGKILTGILAFLPLFLLAGYFVLFFGFMVELFRTMPTGTMEPNTPTTEFFITSFLGMIASLLLLGIVSLIKLIYFIVHINNNTRLDSNEKLVWILVGIFVGMIGFPIYWYLKIWREEAPVA